MQDEQRGHTPGEGTHTFHSLSGVRYQGGAHRGVDVTTEPQGKKEIIGHISLDISHLLFRNMRAADFANKRRSDIKYGR